MRKITKFWLITAILLVLIGITVFGGAMTMLKWDFSKLSTARLETNTHELYEQFSDISVVTNTADVVFLPSEDSTTTVVCHEETKQKHSVSVKDGTLTIELNDTRKWYNYIGFNFSSPSVTVYIPRGEYAKLTVNNKTGDVKIPKDFTFASIDVKGTTGDVECYAGATGDVKIGLSTGNITVSGITAGSLDLSVSTGKISVTDASCTGDVSVNVDTGKAFLTNVNCKSLYSDGDTGDLSLKTVIASEKFSIERDTGDISLNGCDASEIYITTDTGDVEGSLLSEKIFIVRTDTGDVDVPKSTTGGRCEITTDTGDVEITVG